MDKEESLLERRRPSEWEKIRKEGIQSLTKKQEIEARSIQNKIRHIFKTHEGEVLQEMLQIHADMAMNGVLNCKTLEDHRYHRGRFDLIREILSIPDMDAANLVQTSLIREYVNKNTKTLDKKETS